MKTLCAIAAVIAVAVIGGGAWYISLPPANGDLAMPDLTVAAKNGKQSFAENCAACHGTNAAGSSNGPPLIHQIYEPSHHGDRSFYRAVRAGVTAHHWRFGNMPPITTVSKQDVDNIIVYIREVQRANGIF